MKAKEVIELKSKQIERIDKVIQRYNKWIKGQQIFSNKVLIIILILSITLLYLFYHIELIKFLCFCLCSISAFILLRRDGHKEGYIDGYFHGVDNGINEALGIDKNEEEFIEQIRIDDELNKK